MKKFLLISIILFGASLLMKMLVLPMSTFPILIISAVVVIVTIVYTLKNFKEKRLVVSSWLVASAMLLTVVCVKFQMLQFEFAIATILLFFILLIISYKKQAIKQSILFLIFGFFGIIIYLIPTHVRFFLININWNQNESIDYMHWDKYSYYLYSADEYEGSLNASENAKKIVLNSKDEKWIKIIQEHNTCIRSKCKWETYR